jgi:hypothetical protein
MTGGPGSVPGGPDVAGLAALVGDRPPVGAVRLVTVDGFSGAGKSRLTNRLARALGRVPTVHLDFFYPGWDGLAAGVALAVEWVAVPLAAGRPARWRRYDWEAGRFGEWRQTPWAPVVVLEGCGAGSSALRPFTATAIWIDTPAPVREQRLRARHDWPHYAPHRSRWAGQEDAYFAGERPWEHADVRVDGDPRNCRWGDAG